MKRNWVPRWDEKEAKSVCKEHKGKLIKRPKGKKRYSLLGAEKIYDGWGVRIQVWPSGHTYVLCSNAFKEENWVEASDEAEALDV